MTDYTKLGKIPPVSPDDLVDLKSIANILQELIGSEFKLSGKSKTDGNKFRKKVTEQLMQNDMTPEPAEESDYEIVPPKKKGVPRFLRYYIDTYIVTTGKKYNLQVWNRNPTSDYVQVSYSKLEKKLRANDVIFVFGKIKDSKIDTIIVTTPNKIVEKFGQFGVPTSKQQLIISDAERQSILNTKDKILFYTDDVSLKDLLNKNQNTSGLDAKSRQIRELLPLEKIKEVAKELIGIKLKEKSTRKKGVELEKYIIHKLGYQIPNNMEGKYPDIPNQLLEVKVQESPTVDLGKYSPQNIEVIDDLEIIGNNENSITTQNIRYIIALTNSKTSIIEGFYIGPGAKLGQKFTYVLERSSKYQKGIDMSFFDKYSGKSVAIE